MKSEADSTNQPVPVPPRYAWLKRSMLLAMIVVLALLALRLSWEHRLRQRLAEYESATRARGELWSVQERSLSARLDAANAVSNLEDLTRRQDVVSALDPVHDGAAAVQRIRDVVRRADAIEVYPSELTYLNALSSLNFTLLRSQWMVSILAIDGNGPGAEPASGSAATPQQVRELIVQLLDESRLRQSTRATLLLERARELDGLEKQWGEHWFVEPLGLRRQIATCEDYEPILVTLPNLRTAGSSILDSETGARAERSGLAIALAVRLFFVEHNRLPESLNEMVPEQLPFLPPDPYAADGRPFRYVLIDRDRRALLLSVGSSGVDPVAYLVEPLTNEHLEGPNRPEWWRDLNREQWFEARIQELYPDRSINQPPIQGTAPKQIPASTTQETTSPTADSAAQ